MRKGRKRKRREGEGEGGVNKRGLRVIAAKAVRAWKGSTERPDVEVSPALNMVGIDGRYVTIQA